MNIHPSPVPGSPYRRTLSRSASASPPPSQIPFGLRYPILVPRTEMPVPSQLLSINSEPPDYFDDPDDVIPYEKDLNVVGIVIHGWNTRRPRRQVRVAEDISTGQLVPLPPQPWGAERGNPDFSLPLSAQLSGRVTVIQLMQAFRDMIEAAPQDFSTDISADRRYLLFSLPSYLLAVEAV